MELRRWREIWKGREFVVCDSYCFEIFQFHPRPGKSTLANCLALFDNRFVVGCVQFLFQQARAESTSSIETDGIFTLFP